MATTGGTTVNRPRPDARSATSGTTAIPTCRSGGTLIPKGCPLRGTRGAAVRRQLGCTHSAARTILSHCPHVESHELQPCTHPSLPHPHPRSTHTVASRARARTHKQAPHDDLYTTYDTPQHIAYMSCVHTQGALKTHGHAHASRPHQLATCHTCRLLYVVRHQLRARQLGPWQH